MYRRGQCSRSYVMPQDWKARNSKLEFLSQNMRATSHQAGNLADQEKLDWKSKTHWNSHCTSVALRSRINEVEKMQALFSKCLYDIREEGKSLLGFINKLENSQEDLQPILEVITECLTLRDERQEKELVNDEAAKEISQTQSVVNNYIGLLQSLINDGHELLQNLHKHKQTFEKAITCQGESQEIDRNLLFLDWSSPDVSLKPDPIRQPQGTVSHPVWENSAMQMLAAAGDSAQEAKTLQQKIRLALIHLEQDVRNKREATLYALRRRVHEEQQAVNHLEWQDEYLSSELSLINNKISSMECFQRDLRNPMKVAQTRHEGRGDRCPNELCFDEAQDQLCNEIVMCNEAQMMLGQKLNNARETRNGLEYHLEDVRADLRSKRASLNIDKQCLEILKRLREFQPLCPSPKEFNFSSLPEPQIS